MVNTEFNVGALEFKTVREDLSDFFETVGSRSRVMSTPSTLIKAALSVLNWLGLSPVYQWVYDTADKDSFVSVEKLIAVTGWKPKYSNAQSLIRAYQWYEKHYKEVEQGGDGVTHRVRWNQGILGLVKKILR